METIALGGGWIYLLLTSNDFSCCKIGTSIEPLKRFRQLRTGNPNLGLLVAYYIPEHAGSSQSIESSIHGHFQDHRILTHDETSSEWFTIRPEEAQLQIECLLEEWCEQIIRSASNFDSMILTRFYESELREMFEPDSEQARLAKDIIG